MPGPGWRLRYLGDYELTEEVARGGMGVVYKARQRSLNRMVAVKMILAGHLAKAEAVQRFRAEARAAAGLQHPNIVPIYEVGEQDGQHYFSMEFVDGSNLSEVVRENPLPASRAARYVKVIAEAIQFAHERGVLHRDLKPSNVLLDAFDQPRVTDFGLAKNLADNSELTQTGEVLGAPSFVPPEQAAGRKADIGPHSDVYALGAVLYHLLTGRPPFAAETMATTLAQVLDNEPAAPRALNPGIPRDLETLCLKCLEKPPHRRYQTARELAEELGRFLRGQPIRARPVGYAEKTWRWARRHPAAAGLGVTALLLVATATVGVLSTAILASQRDLARQLSALRSGDLARRAGNWRTALRYWGEAESAGFNDPIHLGLRRAEAWTVLGFPSHSKTELDKLARRSDLGEGRGEVLLRIGEHEMFDSSTFERGAQRVREALQAGLSGADSAFARGLLAETSPDALADFREALKLDPYHHGAHCQSLGLEYLLGRHTELVQHSQTFKLFFPDDPSAGFLEASTLASCGRLVDAQKVLAGLRMRIGQESWGQAHDVLDLLAAGATHYDLDELLSGRLTNFVVQAGFAPDLLPWATAWLSLSNAPASLRLPRHPCFQHYVEGWRATTTLAVPLVADLDQALSTIKSGWQHHPEALLPVTAAMLLESWHPPNRPIPSTILVKQAELFQLGAASSSVLAAVPRWARFHGARTQFELVRRRHLDAAVARQACLDNLRHAANADETSLVECRACFDMALALGDQPTSRALLERWGSLSAGDELFRRTRIQFELAAGAFGAARQLLDQWLAEKPADPWALQEEQQIAVKLEELLNTVRSRPDSNQATERSQ